MGASQANGLGGPEGPEPHSRLRASHAIPSAWPEFNLNCFVKVKLTEFGLRCLEKNHNELCEIVPGLGPFVPPRSDENGWTRFQLWVLMQELGPHIAMGNHAPFETSIALDPEQISGNLIPS